MGDLFGAIDFDWLMGRIAGEQPVQFIIWSAFAMAAGFAFGMWWRRREERSLIDDRFGKVPEFSRVRTLSDLMEKADELAQSASAEVMLERTQRIAELEDKVARQALEIDRKRAENAKLKEIVESTGAGEAARLQAENIELRAELTRIKSTEWYERYKEGGAIKQARGRLAKLLPNEAKTAIKLYENGSLPSDDIDPGILQSLRDKRAIVDCDVPTPSAASNHVRLSDQMTKDLNRYMDVFEELFGV